MRELALMRHAEAAPLQVGGSDFNRPLTADGALSAAEAAGRLLAQHGAPDLILCSPALRTRQTAEIVRATLRIGAVPITEDPRLYLALPLALRLVLRDSVDTARRVLLVGHNPTISALAESLQPQLSGCQLATAEFRLYTLPIDHWKLLEIR